MAAPVEDRPDGVIPPTIHQKRFVVAFAALAVLLAVAVGIAAWLAERGRTKPWTDHPIAKIEDPVARAEAVATLVQNRYLDDDGTPIVTVTAGEDVLSDGPGRDQVVAMYTNPDGPPLSFEYGNIVFFKMCGPGPGCAYDTRSGALPQHVLALTAREARELALRGLKNVPEADSAMVIMPTGILQPDSPGGTPPTVVSYYRRDDSAVKQSLDNRLSPDYEAPEPTPTQLGDEAARTMFDNYSSSLFRLNTPKPSQDGNAVIYELVPPPPAG